MGPPRVKRIYNNTGTGAFTTLGNRDFVIEKVYAFFAPNRRTIYSLKCIHSRTGTLLYTTMTHRRF